MPLSDSSQSHYLAVVTLLDQLDPQEYNWQWLSVILEGQSPLAPENLLVLFDRTKSNYEFSQIVFKFLIDRD